MENIAKLKLPLGQSPPRIHCPVCGNKIITDGAMTSCDHLLYFFMSACGEFIYLRDDIKNFVDRSFDKNRDIEEIFGTIFEKIRKPSAMGFEITYSGTANGSSWETDYVGFDF